MDPFNDEMKSCSSSSSEAGQDDASLVADAPRNNQVEGAMHIRGKSQRLSESYGESLFNSSEAAMKDANGTAWDEKFLVSSKRHPVQIHPKEPPPPSILHRSFGDDDESIAAEDGTESPCATLERKPVHFTAVEPVVEQLSGNIGHIHRNNLRAPSATFEEVYDTAAPVLKAEEFNAESPQNSHPCAVEPGAFAVPGIGASTLHPAFRHDPISTDVPSVIVASRVEEVPTVEAILIDGDKGMRNCARNHRKRFVLLVFGVAAAIIAVVAVLATNDWSPSFTLNSATFSRREALTKALSNVSSKDDLNEPASPQYKAFEWMMSEENHESDVVASNNVPRIIQRYVLAVLYYATGGPNWIDQHRFLSKGGECSWIRSDSVIDQHMGVSCDSHDFATAIRLRDNGLNGTLPREIGHLHKMTFFQLWGNEALSGEIPSQIGLLTDSMYITLSKSSLTGQIPSEIGRLSRLKELYLNENRLSGSICTELGDLINLTMLSLSDNALTASIPSELGKLKALTNLRLFRNSLNSTIPSSIGGLRALNDLDLSQNNLMGHVIPEIGSLTALSGDLFLHTNQLTGSIPTNLGRLTNLSQLALSTNWLTGTVPTELGRLTRVEYLALGSNRLVGKTPSELAQMASLTSLQLWGNKLSGTIPTSIGELTALTSLGLSHNELTGSIPRELASLAGLSANLYLQQNSLTGNIPPQLGDLTRLAGDLALHTNLLNGSIPASLGNLTRLSRLDLADNLLTGTIASELFGRMTRLTHLSLSFNSLRGTVPRSLAGLTSATDIYLQENAITGSVDFLCDNLEHLVTLWVDLDEVNCTCCDCCPA